jgi:hypothetical protein
VIDLMYWQFACQDRFDEHPSICVQMMFVLSEIAGGIVNDSNLSTFPIPPNSNFGHRRVNGSVHTAGAGTT